MTNKTIGKIYEKRGDDTLTVITTPDGDVVGVEQYDAIGHRYNSINFFAETAPRLVALIQKAAGIKDEKVEYEYASQLVDVNAGAFRVTEREWRDDRKVAELLVQRSTEENAKDEAKWGKNGMTFRLVKRRKAGPVETV